ncbi:very-short-patch-repair endonuclease [Flavobacterium sp. PL11]|nr:very-short-patch-repair endonuclease [Flavobacterium sp. PL11]
MLQVHKGKFWNIDFDRQRIIGNYIVDFYVKTFRLIVEIDGLSHSNKELYDQKREDYFVSLQFKFFRIPNNRIKHDLNDVMIKLEHNIVKEFETKMTRNRM